jgi:threonine synthase
MKWQYLEEFQQISADLGLNMYPSPVLFTNVTGRSFAVKHDDMLELGCSKQRSLSYMIVKYIQQGKKKFVVSSSGNAGLVSAYTVLRHPDASLKVFLSNTISDQKLEKFILKLKVPVRLKDFRNGGTLGNVEFILCDNPKQRAIQHGNDGWINLRGSQDDLALVGFRTISYELLESNDLWDAVFVPASSGTTAVGIYEGFREAGLKPAMHIVQTTKVNTLVNKLPKIHGADASVKEVDHPAESIVDIIGHRRKQVEDIITESGGAGWVISKDDVEKAMRALEALGIQASADAALTFAAFRKSLDTHQYDNPVMVFTG